MRSTSAATALAILTGSVAPSVAAVEPVPAEPARTRPAPRSGDTVNSTACGARKCLYFTE